MATINNILLLSLLTLGSFSNGMTLSHDWRGLQGHGTSSEVEVSRRSIPDIASSLLWRRTPKKISVSSKSSISLSIGGKKDEKKAPKAPKIVGSQTLGNISGHVSLDEVEGLVNKVGKSTCKGTGGIVSFKAVTSETANSVKSSTSCNVKSKSINGVQVTVTPKGCKSRTKRSYFDPVLKQRVKVVSDCNLGLDTLVYNDPEIGKQVAQYKKGDFTIRRFSEADDFYGSIAYFVGCATNGQPVELGSAKNKVRSANLMKRGFFKGNTKDPIWNCATPNVDTVGGPRNSFLFAPANVGECLVIMASRECLEQDSVAFFWDE